MKQAWIGLCLCIVAQMLSAQSVHRGRAFTNGPVAHDFQYDISISAHEVLRNMMAAVEHSLLPAIYGRARVARISAELDFEVPGSRLSSQTGDASLSFSAVVTGHATPNGKYRYQFEGDFGEVEVSKDHRKSLIVSHDFRAFSDHRNLARSPLANLTSFRSYALRQLSQFKAPLFDSGMYRVASGGQANFDGRLIHVIRVFKPPKRKERVGGPIPIDRLWKFWRDGAYEIWVYQDTKLPAAVFFTGIEDNVFANLRFVYDREHMLSRLVIENNSPGFEGRGSLTFAFDEERRLQNLRLEFLSDRGHDILVDADIDFVDVENPDVHRLMPPFGYQKVNRDHLKLLVTTHLAGGLLNLKKHGVNIRNFKF